MNSPFIASSSASDQYIAGVQAQYGVIDYNNWQDVRWTFEDWVTYPEAGASVLNFFGNIPGVGGATTYTTNMVKQGSFGQQHFLIKSIGVGIRIKSNDLTLFDGSDASTLASDYLLGFVQAGLLTYSIGARPFASIPKPFMYAPQPGSQPFVKPAGLTSLTATETGATATMATVVSDTPFVRQINLKQNIWRTDPQLFVAAEQQFTAQIGFPSGLVPIIGTGITDDTTNPLQVGVILDGVLIRPKQ